MNRYPRAQFFNFAQISVKIEFFNILLSFRANQTGTRCVVIESKCKVSYCLHVFFTRCDSEGRRSVCLRKAKETQCEKTIGGETAGEEQLLEIAQLRDNLDVHF